MENSALVRLLPAYATAAVMLVITLFIYKSPFWLDTSIVVGIFSLLALSVGVSYGQAGILSLATAAFASMGAYATAILSVRYGISPYLTLLVSLGLPAAIAYPLSRAICRLSPLPLLLATLMLSTLVETGFRWGGDFTGGYIGLSGISKLSIAAAPLSMHLLVWSIVFVVLVVYANLIHSSVGRAANVAKHDPLRAVADGVDVPGCLAVFFSLSAALAGLAGWLYAHHFAYVGADSLGMHVSVQALLMAIVGGVSTLLGPIVGAAALILVNSYLPTSEALGMVFGALLLLVLLLAPEGLLGGDRIQGIFHRSALRRVRKILHRAKAGAPNA